MDYYKIFWKASVEKDLRKVDQQHISRIIEAIEKLKNDPFPFQYKKLRKSENEFRIRVGDYRIIYGVETTTKQIIIKYIRHRKDAYYK